MEDVVAETRWKLAKQSFWGTCAKNAFTQMWGMYVEYMCFWNYEGVARNQKGIVQGNCVEPNYQICGWVDDRTKNMLQMGQLN